MKPRTAAPSTKFVVTLPPEPSPLRRALEADIASAYVALTDTTHAFQHVAISAKGRLVIMMPFIDRVGAAWALELFEATAAPEKVLILRDAAKLDLCGEAGEAVRAVATTILDYGGPDVDTTSVETFHAKIVLADGTVAYVGSANLLRRSRSVNLECGMLVEGAAVFGVKVLVDAVITSLT